MAEQFSLCWDNFHSNMSSSFSELLKSEDLVDVTLAAEGRYLKAHKIVLSVCSPYFQELFHVNPCQHPIVFLKDVSYSALSNLLQFMYQGEVKVSQDELTNFIKVAEALKIKGLTGDGMKENESKETLTHQNDIPEVSVPKETTLSRKSTFGGRSSPTRKKMLGPASKRPRSDLPEIPPHMIEDVRTLPPDTEQFMNFKMEPEDQPSQYDDTNDDFGYGDTNPEVSNTSDSADYLMETSAEHSMKEVKPGTSSNSEPAGDNQDSRKSKNVCRKGRSEPDSSIRMEGLHWAHFPRRIPPTERKLNPTRQCRVCTKQKIRSETAYECMKCQTALHIIDCFERYHTVEDY